MRVALVSPYDYPYPGGVTEHVSHLRVELGRLGHQAEVIAPSSLPGQPPAGLRRVGSVIGIPANGSVARLGLSLGLVGRVRDILRREAFDLVHLHEPLLPGASLAALLASRGVNVGTFHACWSSNWAYRWARPLLRRCFDRLDGRIAVSEAAREFVSGQFPGDYALIPNGVDRGRFSPEVPPLPGLRDGKLNVLFVGRLEKRKGLGHLIRACSALRRRDLRLIVVGASGGARRRRYAALARDSGVDALFAGYVAPGLLPRYYASADVCCAPSIGGESFGVVLLEAMATGRAVVASDLPGYRAAVPPWLGECLAPPADASALAAALARLLDSPALRAELGEQGRRWSRQFDWARIARRVVQVYEQAAAGRGAWQKSEVLA